jgi:ribosomal protein S18 acetylase RimI-like enzyme
MRVVTTSPRDATLDRLEEYYDAAPRARSDIEQHGPLTLFVARGGWPYYARPRLGLDQPVNAAEVTAVLARQRELGVPQAVEWVHETTPSLHAAVVEAGMTVELCPLLVLDGPPVVRAGAAEVREVGPDDPALSAVQAAISVGFGQAGTAVGEASVAERDAWAARETDPGSVLADVLRSGSSVLFGAFDADAGAVGGGSHNPRVLDGGGVTEVVGVGVLPAYRRRGIAAHLSGALALHALESGMATVFCSAADDDVARVYESVGFRRVGTAGIAEVP